MSDDKPTTVTSVASMFRDMYPTPGTRLKQWVVDARKEREWIGKTCPIVVVPPHEDNTGMPCNGTAIWYDLEGHHCCSECNDAAEAARTRTDVAAWLSLYANRPKPTSDRDALSDEIAPDLAMGSHPLLGMLSK